MNPLPWLFENLIFNPQLNILNLFYSLTGDVGWAIVLLALVVNLSLWPLFWSTYVNGQKLRLLQPQLKRLQEEYKEKPQEFLKQSQDFYKKHGVNNSAFFLVIFAQIFFAVGLLNVTQAVSSTKPINGLYEIFWGKTQAIFDNPIAFGSINVGLSSSSYIWIAVANLILSFAYGWYTFRLAPKPTLRDEMEKKIKERDLEDKKKKGEKEKDAVFDPQQMQKMIEFQTIWLFPWLMFFSNLAFNLGVNIYFVTVSLLSLTRQIIVTYYYSKNEGKLLESIINSDPLFHDNNPSNNLEITGDPAIMQDTEPVAELILNDLPANKLAKKTNKNLASGKNKKGKK